MIEDYDYLRRIRVPKGIYISSKGLQMQSDQYENDDDDSYSSSISPPPRSPSIFRSGPPTPYTTSSIPTSPAYPGMYRTPHGYASSSSSRGSSYASSPYVLSDGPDYMTPFALAPSSRYANSIQSSSRHGSDPRTISPLTSEDRRALDAFRVEL